MTKQDSPVVPIGRSPRTDVLLKAEKEVMASGGCVLRLAGLYISFMHFNSTHTLTVSQTLCLVYKIAGTPCCFTQN